MEHRKGFLAIGAIILFCIAVSAALILFGWYWLKNSGVLEDVGATFLHDPINIERSVIEDFLSKQDYQCGKEGSESFGDNEFQFCEKQTPQDTFTLGITYSKQHNKPVSMNLSVPKTDRPGQRELVETEFQKLISLPYEGVDPEEASAWLTQCLAFEGTDTLNISKSISNLTFTVYILTGQYTLSISPVYDYE